MEICCVGSSFVGVGWCSGFGVLEVLEASLLSK